MATLTPTRPTTRRRPDRTSQTAQKIRADRRPRKIGTYLLLSILLAVTWFPIYYMLVGSVMTSQDLLAFPTRLLPLHGFDLSHYADALRQVPMIRQYGNSILMAVIITAAQLTTSVLAAYAFVFLPLKHRSVWFGVFLATLMVPAEATIIPNYLLLANNGLTNTIWALVLPFLATGFGVFLARQSFMVFPKELRDAARIDGCRDLRFLWQILVPLSKPTLAAIGVWSFMSAWNMYLWPLLVSTTPETQTVQIGLSQLKSPDSFIPGTLMAGAVIAVIPALLLMIFGQRFVVRGLTAGSLK
jgi:sn-glycerol 3-phosphate transport system permease protein